jgi:hypothetical protein
MKSAQSASGDQRLSVRSLELGPDVCGRNQARTITDDRANRRMVSLVLRLGGVRVFIRLVVISLFCALLANCAALPAPEMSAQSNVASTGWGRGTAEAEPEPARHKPRRVAQRAKSEEPRTTGSASAARGNDITPLSPEWHAAEDAEAQRLKRLSNICRC